MRLHGYSIARSITTESDFFVLCIMAEFEDDVIFEYHITINDEDFNLGVLTMKTPEGTFEVDFDK